MYQVKSAKGSKNQSCSEWPETHFVLEFLKSNEIFVNRKKKFKWRQTSKQSRISRSALERDGATNNFNSVRILS